MNKDKITKKEKLSYSLVNMGNIPIMALINGYLLIFYTNVCGINPAACATLFLIARIMDGLNDPLEGFIIDHLPNTKMGHFRPTLIIGSVLCSLNFLLLWFGPMLVTEGKLAIAYVSYLLIGVMFSCMDISLNSMLPVMTTDTDERNKLSAIKGISYTVGGIAVAVSAPLILGNASNKEGYIKLISIFTAVIFLFSIIGTLGIKERVKPQEEKRYSFKDIFKIFTQKPVLITFMTVLVASVGGNIGGTVGTYYFTYIFGDLSISSLIALVTVATFLPATMIAPKFISKYGKKCL